jgi:hypothetical protein
VASAIVFLAYSFLMFQAGYQWHKWGRRPDAAHQDGPRDSAAAWDGMIGKI